MEKLFKCFFRLQDVSISVRQPSFFTPPEHDVYGVCNINKLCSSRQKRASNCFQSNRKMEYKYR